MKQVQWSHLLANLDLAFSCNTNQQKQQPPPQRVAGWTIEDEPRGCGSVRVTYTNPATRPRNYGADRHQDSLLGGHGLGTIDYGLVTIDLPDRRPEE